MKRSIFILSAILVLAGFWYYSRNWRTFDELRFTFLAMGGIPVEVKAYGTTRSTFEAAAKSVQKRFEDLEQEMSTYRETSLASRINRDAGLFPVRVEPDTWRVLASARDIWQRTEGMYDPTVRPLIRLWKAAGASGRMPGTGLLEDARARTGMQHVRLDPVKKTVYFDVPGMSIDLGGIAKGYFCDEGVAILRSFGIRRGIVNAAGDLVAFDDREAPRPFRIGIRSPAGDGLETTVEIRGGAVMTSGNYERYVTIEGKRYSHIINPVTGRPANRCRSVTILGPSGMIADALATGVAVCLSDNVPYDGMVPGDYRVLDPLVGDESEAHNQDTSPE